jgi:hypothetical protein
MGWNLPDGPDSYLSLLKAIDRKAFGVHLDVFNGINSPQRFYKHEEFIRECFRKLGPHIASCHAKDLDWPAELQVHFNRSHPRARADQLPPVLEELSKLKADAPLMLEHLKTAEEYEEAKRHILKVGAETGVTFA